MTATPYSRSQHGTYRVGILPSATGRQFVVIDDQGRVLRVHDTEPRAEADAAIRAIFDEGIAYAFDGTVIMDSRPETSN